MPKLNKIVLRRKRDGKIFKINDHQYGRNLKKWASGKYERISEIRGTATKEEVRDARSADKLEQHRTENPLEVKFRGDNRKGRAEARAILVSNETNEGMVNQQPGEEDAQSHATTIKTEDPNPEASDEKTNGVETDDTKKEIITSAAQAILDDAKVDTPQELTFQQSRRYVKAMTGNMPNNKIEVEEYLKGAETSHPPPQ